MSVVQLAAARRPDRAPARLDARRSAPTSPASSAAARRSATASSSRSSGSLYRVCGVDPAREQTWPVYALALLAFSLVSVLGLYSCSGSRARCRSNPTDAKAVPPALAFNTAV